MHSERLKIFRIRKCLIHGGLLIFLLWVNGCGPTTAKKQKRVKAFQDLGNAMATEGNLRGALAELLKGLKLDPDNATLNHQAAVVLRNLGQYELSLKYFRKSLELDPKFSEARNNMGTVYLIMEKWDPAIACFQETLGDLLYKTPQYAYNNMGYAYYMKGDYDKAIECYKQAIRSFRAYTVAHVNLGRAYAAKGDLEAAEAAYKNAILYSPKDGAAHLGLARLLLKRGNQGAAKEELNLTIWADPMSREAQEARELLKRIKKE